MIGGINGRILVHGPTFLPGFGSGTRIPLLIYVGDGPISAISFIILAIPLCTSDGAWCKYSALILSMVLVWILLLQLSLV